MWLLVQMLVSWLVHVLPWLLAPSSGLASDWTSDWAWPWAVQLAMAALRVPLLGWLQRSVPVRSRLAREKLVLASYCCTRMPTASLQRQRRVEQPS